MNPTASHHCPIPREGFPVATKDGNIRVVDAGVGGLLYKRRPPDPKPRTARRRLRDRHRRYAAAGGTLSFREWAKQQGAAV